MIYVHYGYLFDNIIFQWPQNVQVKSGFARNIYRSGTRPKTIRAPPFEAEIILILLKNKSRES
jgi:hypothetical protein